MKEKNELEVIAKDMAYAFTDPEYADKDKFPWNPDLDGCDYESAVQCWMEEHILLALYKAHAGGLKTAGGHVEGDRAFYLND